MKGIILAGGTGSRLHPITLAVSKQLLPVYDRPMVCYPLEILRDLGISDILLISTPKDIDDYRRLLGDAVSYAVQPEPKGIAQAFIIGRDFVGNDSVILILGDNLFFGPIHFHLAASARRNNVATIFAYPAEHPERYGVIELDETGRPVSIEEKPTHPKSNLAVTGLYIYDNRVLDIAERLKPSARGELEITDVNRAYLESGRLHVEILDFCQWFDCGTFRDLLNAGNYARSLNP